jgi:hypothetical protein
MLRSSAGCSKVAANVYEFQRASTRHRRISLFQIEALPCGKQRAPLRPEQLPKRGFAQRRRDRAVHVGAASC